MQTVADQDHGPGRMITTLLVRRMYLAVVRMAVSPQHQFFQQEKPQQSQQYRHRNNMCVGAGHRVQRMRQQAQKGRTQQSAGCEAHQVR